MKFQPVACVYSLALRPFHHPVFNCLEYILASHPDSLPFFYQGRSLGSRLVYTACNQKPDGGKAWEQNYYVYTLPIASVLYICTEFRSGLEIRNVD